MPIFKKKILDPGTYTVRSKGGKTKKVFISPERLERWVENFQKMRADGLNIPAPWRHDPKAVPYREIGDLQDVDAKNNAGWWKDLRIENGSLIGDVEIPLEEDSKKIGTTVRDVSPLVKSEFIDGGTGGIYEDAITHIALVTHPVVPHQENFRNAMALSSEDYLSSHDLTEEAGEPTLKTEESGVSLSEVLSSLEYLGVHLPKDTDMTNLVERILIACTALRKHKETDDEDDMDLENEPKNATSHPDPIAMSSEDQAKLNFAMKAIKQSYEDRIAECVSRGRATPEMVKKLEPFLADYTIELSAEGDMIEGPLDIILESWESIPEGSFLVNKATKASRPSLRGFNIQLSTEEQLPDENESDVMSEEEADKIIQAQFNMSGMDSLLR